MDREGIMTAGDWMFSLQEAQANLPDNPELFRFRYGLKHGTMKVGLYAPKLQDTQGPHAQDELYIVVSGSGDFIKNQTRRSFSAQDVIFVEAGVDHRFENFSEDFATWVIFWGAQGGEAAGVAVREAEGEAEGEAGGEVGGEVGGR